LISGLSATYLTISNASSTYATLLLTYSRTYIDTLIALYYTKIQSDARYVLQTTPLNSILAPTGNLSMNTLYKITNLAEPTVSTDAVTKNYADGLISGLSSTYLSISNASSTYATLLLTYSRTYIDNLIALYYTKIQSDARYYLNTVTLNNITAPTGNLSMNTLYKITNLAEPTVSTDAVTKNYVDSIGSGISLATAK